MTLLTQAPSGHTKLHNVAIEPTNEGASIITFTMYIINCKQSRSTGESLALLELQ